MEIGEQKKKEIFLIIKKLEEESFINFRSRKSDVEDFIDNDMNYIIFREGRISKYTSCLAACGLTRYRLKELIAKELAKENEDYNKEEKEKLHKYMLENNLRSTWFNFACYKKLGLVFLNKHEYNVIKFHENKQKEVQK